jgi:UrcA family protein
VSLQSAFYVYLIPMTRATRPRTAVSAPLTMHSRHLTPRISQSSRNLGPILTQRTCGNGQLATRITTNTNGASMGRGESHPLPELLVSSACALWASQSACAVVPADPSEPHPTQLVVKYADLDLSKRPGVAELYRRIEVAAHAVCAPRFPGASIQQGLDACFVDAITRAISEINDPALTRYFTTRLQQQR